MKRKEKFKVKDVIQLCNHMYWICRIEEKINECEDFFIKKAYISIQTKKMEELQNWLEEEVEE